VRAPSTTAAEGAVADGENGDSSSPWVRERLPRAMISFCKVRRRLAGVGILPAVGNASSENVRWSAIQTLAPNGDLADHSREVLSVLSGVRRRGAAGEQDRADHSAFRPITRRSPAAQDQRRTSQAALYRVLQTKLDNRFYGKSQLVYLQQR